MPPLLSLKDEDIVGKLTEDFKAADDHRQWWVETKWTPALKEYFMYQDPNVRKKAIAKGRASMTIAKGYEQVETKLPRWVLTTFSQREIIQALPRAKGHEQFCAMNSKLVNAQLRDGKFPVRAITVFKEAIITGSAVVMTPWHEDRVMIRRKMSLTEAYGRTGELTKQQKKLLRDTLNAILKENQQEPMDKDDELPDMAQNAHITDQIETEVRVPETLWEGPVALHLDIFDFWLDPQTSSHLLENCRYVIRRFRRTKEQLEQENARRKELGLEPIYINLDKLDDKGSGARPWSANSAQALRYNVLGIPVPEVKDGGHDLLEFWYDDGTMYTLANDTTLIRKSHNPFSNPKLTNLFHLLVHEPQMGQPWGTGLIEWIHDQLEGYKSIFNNTIDNVNLVLGPPMIANSDRLVNPQDLTSGLRSNQLIYIDNMMNPNETLDNAFKLVTFPTEMVVSGWSQLDRYDQTLEKITGLHGVMKGGESAPRTPFSSEATRLDEANVRIRLNLMVIGEWLSGIAEAFHWRNYQFLPAEYPITLFGTDGEAYVEHAKQEDVRVFLRYRFVGGSLEPLANKQVQAQNATNFLANLAGVLTHAPQVGALIQWAPLLRSILAKHEFLPSEQVIRDTEPAEELAMMLQNPAVIQDPQVQQVLMVVVQQLMQAQQQQMMEQQSGMQGGTQGAPQQAGPSSQAPRGEPEGAQPDAMEEEEAQRENDRLIRGLMVSVAPDDNHFIHLQQHAMALSAAQTEGQDTSVLEQHIAEHQQYATEVGGGAAPQGMPMQGAF